MECRARDPDSATPGGPCEHRTMRFTVYREVWAFPAVRQAILLGALGKAPWFAASVILTLHVVGELGQSYAAAGLLTAVFTVAIAVAFPWRGRLLDTVGLRRTLRPSLLVLPPAFLVAPFVGYWPLLGVMAVVGLLAVPWFVLTRQMVIAAVPVEQRRTALALDSVVTELAFMVGPALGILAAVSSDSRWALAIAGMLSVLAAAALAWRNPPLVAERAASVAASEPAAPGRAASSVVERRGPQEWLTWPVATTFLATVAVTFTLAGTDLSIVAAVRQQDAVGMLAIIIVAWGFGSLIGGLVYGSLGRTVGLTTLLIGLGLTTLTGALAANLWMLAACMTLAGLFCAPSLAATVERLSHAVDEVHRGEAMGWQGTFSTLGNAMAPPLVGFVIDTFGWREGFVATGASGLLLAGAGWLALKAGRRARRHLSAGTGSAAGP